MIVNGLDDTGIISCYPLNNSLNDYFGRYNATLSSGITYVGGVINNGSYINYSNYIQFPGQSELNISSQGTIDLWINITNYPVSTGSNRSQVVLAVYNGSYEWWSNSARGFFIVMENNNTYLITRNGSSSGYYSTKFFNSTNQAFLNRWTHLAFTWSYNATSRIINITTYVNGTARDSDQGYFGGSFNFSRIRIGRDYWQNYYLKNQTVDELHTWSVRKNSSDILALSQLTSQSCIFNSTTSLTSQNLIWELRFENTYNDTLGRSNATSIDGNSTFESGGRCIVGSCLFADGWSEQINYANTSWWYNSLPLYNWSINFWHYDLENTTAKNRHFFWANNTYHGSTLMYMETGRSTGYVRFQYQKNGTSYDMNSHYVRPLELTMITVTFNGTNVSLYKNGSLTASYGIGSGFAIPTPVAGNDIQLIGKRQSSWGNSLNGTIDEFTFWNATLTTTEITTLYNAYIAGIRPTSTASFPAANTTVNATPTTGDIYISKISGSDSNSGNSTHPIKTLTKLFSMWGTSEDAVFACGEGEIWRLPIEGAFSTSGGTSRIPAGTSTNYTMIRTYGTCNETNRPKFTTSIALNSSNWTSLGSNRWKLNPNGGVPIANFIFNSNDYGKGNNSIAYRLIDTASLSSIDVQGEWWQNRTRTATGDYSTIIYSTSNPSTFYNGLEMVYAEASGVSVTGTAFENYNSNYVGYDGIEVMWADIGINTMDRTGMKVNNTIMHHIGGGFCTGGCNPTGFARWGNAIQAYNGMKNVLITNNKVWQVYDAGITSQSSTPGISPNAYSHEIYNNVVYNTGYCYEFFFNSLTATVYDIYFKNNTCYNQGYTIFDDQRSNQTTETTRPRSIRWGGAYNVRNIVAKNNILYNSLQYAYNIQGFTQGWLSNYTMDYNYVWKNTSYGYDSSNVFQTNGQTYYARNSINSTNYETFSEWQTSEGKDAHSLNTYYTPNQLFVDPENANYYLRNYTLKDTGLCYASDTGGAVGAMPCNITGQYLANVTVDYTNHEKDNPMMIGLQEKDGNAIWLSRQTFQDYYSLLGVDIVRLWIAKGYNANMTWTMPTRNMVTYNWLNLTLMLNATIRQNPDKILMSISYAPDAISVGNSSSGNENYEPSNYTAWQAYCNQLASWTYNSTSDGTAETYDQDDIQWEIWNEAHDTEFRGANNSYVDVYLYCYDGIKAANTNAHVGGPGSLSDSVKATFIEDVLDYIPASKYPEFWGFHRYDNGRTFDPLMNGYTGTSIETFLGSSAYTGVGYEYYGFFQDWNFTGRLRSYNPSMNIYNMEYSIEEGYQNRTHFAINNNQSVAWLASAIKWQIDTGINASSVFEGTDTTSNTVNYGMWNESGWTKPIFNFTTRFNTIIPYGAHIYEDTSDDGRLEVIASSQGLVLINKRNSTTNVTVTLIDNPYTILEDQYGTEYNVSSGSLNVKIVGLDVLTLKSEQNETLLGNTPPNVSIFFSPGTAYFNDTISCLVNASDVNDQRISYNGSAYINDVLVANFDSGTGTSTCLQQTANEASECGGLATGVYADNGNFPTGSYRASYAYDGDTDTYAQALSGTIGVIYVNYTKPVDSIAGETWIAYGDPDNFDYVSVPESCFVYDDDVLMLKMTSTRTSVQSSSISCMNSSGWQTLWSQTDPSNSIYSRLYEEWIIWTFDELGTYYDNKLVYTFTDTTNNYDSLTCEINAYDSEDYSVLSTANLNVSNYLPTIQSVQIYPGLSYSNIDLVCQANTTDPEGDDIDYMIVWHSPNWTTSYIRYYFGATSGSLVNISTLNASLIDEQQNITCRIYASDGTDTLNISSEDSILILEDYISSPTITNPSSDGTTVENELNITWLVSNSIGVEVHNYTVRLLNTSYSHLRTLAVGQYDNYFYVDFYTNDISPGTYYLQVIANDTTENLVTADYRRFTANITTLLNVTAYRPIASSYINNFNITITRGSVSSTLSTIDGFVEVDIERNNTYNITLQSSGYYDVNVTNYVITDSYAGLMFNLSQVGSFTLNITFYDESDLSQITQPVYLDFISDYYASNYTAPTGSISITDLELATYTIRYYSAGYTLRFYTITISSTTGNYDLSLYLLNQSSASNITVYVVDEFATPISGLKVKALKYYLSTNSYILQESAITDVGGLVVMSLTKLDEYYKFMIENDDELLKITNPSYIYTDSVTIQILTTELIGEEYFNYNSLQGEVSYNPSTNNFRFDYTDTTGIGTSYCLKVYRGSNMSQTLLDQTCSDSSSATLLLSVGNPKNGTTYSAKTTFFDGGVEKYFTGVSYTYPVDDTMSSYGLFLQILVTLAIIGVAYFSPIIALLLTPLSLLVGNGLGLNAFSIGSLISLQVVSVIIVGIIYSRKG
jgi:hypothetical protein